MTRQYRKLPTEDVLVAIKAHHGNVSAIAEQFDVPRSVIYLKIRAKPILSQAMFDEKEGWKDIAERNIHADLVAGARYATIFVLQTLARDRGWALPKSGVFGDGEPSKIDAINTQAVTIHAFQSGEFAPAGMPAVKITALAPPSETEDDDGIIIDEGPPNETEADDLIIDDDDGGGGIVIEGELAQAPEPPIDDPVGDETKHQAADPEPPPPVRAPKMSWGKVTQREIPERISGEEA